MKGVNEEGVFFVLVDIIVVRVVASQSDERAKAQPIGEEDLSRCVQPHLRNRTLRLDSMILSLVLDGRRRCTSDRTSLLKSGVM